MKKLCTKKITAVLVAIFIMLSGVSVVSAAEKKDSSKTRLTITATQKENSKAIDINWNKVSNATGYIVYRTDFDAFDGANYDDLHKIAEVDAETTYYCDTDLDWYDSYFYLVAIKESDKEILDCNTAKGYVINPAPKFNSIDEVDKTLQKIYHANEYEIVKHSYTESLGETDIYRYHTFYYGSCGPTSRYFQRVLFDNNIYAEIRLTKMNADVHSYNMMRVSFDNGKTVTNIIVDPTYKQTLRSYFSNYLGGQQKDEDIDKEMVKSGLPNVNVVRHGDKQALYEHINSYLEPKGYPDCDVTPTYLYYEDRKYPETELQVAYSYYMNTSEMDKIHQIGNMENPIDKDLYLKSEDGLFVKKLEYKVNGELECFIPKEDISLDNRLYYICDKDSNVIYGADNKDNVVTPYSPFDFNMFSQKIEMFLKKDSKDGFLMNLSNSSGSDGCLLKIDLRAGTDTPVIVPLSAGKYTVGDVNNENSISVDDVTLIAKYIAGFDISSQLKYTGFSVDAFADVNMDSKVDVRDATKLQKYICNIESDNSAGKIFYGYKLENMSSKGCKQRYF